MDISLYFHPVDFVKAEQAGKLTRHTLGYYIRKDTQKASWGRKSGIKAAIFGIPGKASPAIHGSAKIPDEIRKHLYRYSNLEGFRGIVDLGNLKPGRSGQDIHFALRDVVEYLSDNQIISVILGGGHDISIGISRAFREMKDFTLTVVDSRVNIKMTREATDASNFISRILAENPMLFHLQMLALQSHLVSPSVLETLREKTFDYLHLGNLRDNFSDAEPLLRNTTFLSFDISAVRQADANSGWMPSPNGLNGEEACRISHYAGLSQKIKAFGLFEIHPEKEPCGHTYDLTAQIIWYFLDALAHRILADPVTDPAGFNRYYADISGHEIVFFQHPSTDRWWMEVTAEGYESMVIPCREKDYLTAMKNEIPDIWWKYTRKTGRFSK